MIYFKRHLCLNCQPFILLALQKVKETMLCPFLLICGVGWCNEEVKKMKRPAAMDFICRTHLHDGWKESGGGRCSPGCSECNTITPGTIPLPVCPNWPHCKLQWCHCCSILCISMIAYYCLGLKKSHGGVQYDKQQLAASSAYGGPGAHRANKQPLNRTWIYTLTLWMIRAVPLDWWALKYVSVNVDSVAPASLELPRGSLCVDMRL